MEVLAAATTVTAVLDASWRVIKYINSAKGATQERKKLREELRACESVLQQLKDEVDDSEEGQAWTETLRALEAPGAPLGRLLVTLGEVEAKLQPQEGRRKLLTSMRWPFNEKELKEIFSMIEREKALLMLAISNNTRLLVQRINATAEESNEQLRRLLVTLERDSDQTRQAQDILKDGVATIQKTQVQIGENIDNLSRRHAEQESAEQRTRVLSWLSDIDYAGHHKDLIANRHEGTGSWLVESPIFKEWFESPAADELFCPGMPGAGKTILSSVVIDWLLSQSQNQRHLGTQRVGVAYMYCNFRRPEEQVVRRVLASLLKQLGQNWDVLPDQIRALYNTCYGRGVDPSVGQLLTTIRSVGTLYSSVYIIIDALDEAKEEDGFRQQLISSLYAIQLDEKSKLFLTSRFNSDVIGMLKKSRTIEIRASDEDVKTYLNAQMPRLPAFVSRSTDLQAEVEAGISKVVDGM
jgi:Cdc6-like AAA superfamily ATPase